MQLYPLSRFFIHFYSPVCPEEKNIYCFSSLRWFSVSLNKSSAVLEMFLCFMVVLLHQCLLASVPECDSSYTCEVASGIPSLFLAVHKLLCQVPNFTFSASVVS